VEQALLERRSIRRYDSGPLTLEELGQLLWAAQGITHRVPESPPGFPWEWRGGYRTAPSAGALYPLELYAVVGHVDGLRPGLYRYVPVEHALRAESRGDLRAELARAAHGQTVVSSAPVSLLFAGVPARTAAKYGERAGRYVHMEVGAAGENVFLQCESLGLATVFVGAFDDQKAKQAIGLPAGEDVFAIMPVGRRSAE
jgi:SagB-type dehydrogenase family enzyme